MPEISTALQSKGINCKLVSLDGWLIAPTKETPWSKIEQVYVEYLLFQTITEDLNVDIVRAPKSIQGQLLFSIRGTARQAHTFFVNVTRLLKQHKPLWTMSYVDPNKTYSKPQPQINESIAEKLRASNIYLRRFKRS